MGPNLVHVRNEWLRVTVVEAPSSLAGTISQQFDRGCVVVPGSRDSASGEPLTQRIIVGTHVQAPVTSVSELVQEVLHAEYETKTIVQQENRVVVEILGPRKKG